MLHFNVRGGSQLLDEGCNRVSSSVHLDSAEADLQPGSG